jgi:hypothetical protein
VKKFIKGEAHEYPAVEVQWIPGQVPELDLLNIRKEVIEKIILAPMSTDAIRELLSSHGITKKTPKPDYVIFA